MAEQLPERDRREPAEAAPSAGLPRWVKVFAIVAAVVAILVVAMLLAGHGHGRHG